jgi:hypothetical protein
VQRTEHVFVRVVIPDRDDARVRRVLAHPCDRACLVRRTPANLQHLDPFEALVVWM